MHRFFVSPEILRRPRIILPDEIAHQIRTVLRMRVGEVITLLDGLGTAFTVQITIINREQVAGEITMSEAAQGEPDLYIALYQATLKKDNFEWALEKGTEIGVSLFVPIITDRSIAREVDERKFERWGRIVTEAAEQCGRAIIPELEHPTPFQEAVEGFDAYDLLLILDTSPDAPSIGDVVGEFRGQYEGVPSVGLIVGPEGDFTREEVTAAIGAGAKPVSLGQRILRAETAGIAAAAMLMYEWEL